MVRKVIESKSYSQHSCLFGSISDEIFHCQDNTDCSNGGWCPKDNPDKGNDKGSDARPVTSGEDKIAITGEITDHYGKSCMCPFGWTGEQCQGKNEGFL